MFSTRVSSQDDQKPLAHLREFCSSTSIHGMQYLGESKRPSFERLCWLLILLVSVGVCLYSIHDKWHKYETSPVIISFAETTTPIWQVPFPAVTVCSYLKSRATIFNYTRVWNQWNKYHNLTAEDQETFNAVSLVCDLKDDYPGELVTDEAALDILREVGPKMEDTIVYVRWRDVEINATTLFRPILIDGGICHTFNMLSVEEFYTTNTVHEQHGANSTAKKVEGWSLDDGYTQTAGLLPYPNRGYGTGNGNGLTIVMNVHDKDRDFVCRGPFQGFKLYVHNPAEIPNRNTKATVLSLNQDTTVTVKPVLMTTSDDLKSYSPERRQCHYPSSKRLRFYSVYTQGNCRMECATNYTRYLCECVAFYMPRDSNTSICGAKSADCLEYSRRELPKKEIQSQLTQTVNSVKDSPDQFDPLQCDCLPSCTELQYDTKIWSMAFNWKEVYGGFQEAVKPGMNKVRANIYFEDMEIFTSRRSELYGRTDFLASCGGLLGLFMGFSILSLVELVYFFTIRACCNQYRRHVSMDKTDAVQDVEMAPSEETKDAF